MTDGEAIQRLTESFVAVAETDVLERMAEEVKACNIVKGWYDESRTFGDDVALLHSEVSEMLEAFRMTGSAVDQTEYAPGSHALGEPGDQCHDQHGGLVCVYPAEHMRPLKPEGVGAEAADVLVRLLDTCSRYGIDLFSEWRRKVDYNWTRPERHGGKAL